MTAAEVYHIEICPHNIFHPEPTFWIFPSGNSLISSIVLLSESKSWRKKYFYRFIRIIQINNTEHSTYQLFFIFKSSLLLTEILLMTIKEHIAPSFSLITSCIPHQDPLRDASSPWTCCLDCHILSASQKSRDPPPGWHPANSAPACWLADLAKVSENFNIF